MFSYLATYCPVVRDAYESDADMDYSDETQDGATIDDWIMDRADVCLGTQAHLTSKVRIVLTQLWEPYTGGRVFIMPSASEAAWAALTSDLDAVDIVDICGYSVVGASRVTLADHGPEFYIVPRTPDSPCTLDSSPKYSANADVIMKAYTHTVIDMATRIIAKTISDITDHPTLRNLVHNVNAVISSAIEHAIQNVGTMHPTTSKAVDTTHYHAMMHVSSDKHRCSTVPESFRATVKTAIVKTIGADIGRWINTKMQKALHRIHKHGPVRPHIIERRLKRAIGASMKKDRRTPHYDICNYIETGEDRLSMATASKRGKGRRRRMKKKKKKKRSSAPIASWMRPLDEPCSMCDKLTCEDSKSSRALGQLAAFSNPSDECPEHTFGLALKRVSGLKGWLDKCVTNSKSIGTRSTPTVVMVCPSSGAFRAETSMFSVKTAKKMAADGDPALGIPLTTKSGETAYRLLGNRLTNSEGSIDCMEYMHPDVSHVLFLVHQ